jgi:hypothetical protein
LGGNDFFGRATAFQLTQDGVEAPLAANRSMLDPYLSRPGDGSPFLSGSSILGIQEPIATVIILDDSLSMQAKPMVVKLDGLLALQSIDEVLKSLPDGSESHLVLAGQSQNPFRERHQRAASDLASQSQRRRDQSI